MSDDVERVARALSEKSHRQKDIAAPWWDDAASQPPDTIRLTEDQREGWKELARAALAASRSYSDEIVEALEPFARAAERYEAAPAPLPSGLPDGWTCSVRLGDLRRARAALSKVKDQV